MDPINIEKLQAMRRYKKNGFLLNFIQYCLSGLFFGLFLSSPLWLPKLCSSLSHFFLVSLPNIGTFLFCPKCLFVMCNAIIIFLFGESKLSGSSMKPDIYEEYVEWNKSLRRTSTGEGKERETELEEHVVEESVEKKDEVKEEGVMEQDDDDEEEEEEEEEEEDEEEKCGGEEEGGGDDNDFNGEEENALPAEELNKRVEDFIAMVNKQRRLEARILFCSG